ncbi:DUF4926 domain-containing protein [Methylobacterium sp. WL9]|nr:DUF4926 domain-containing protein [Methylobacterium sp. WL9]
MTYVVSGRPAEVRREPAFDELDRVQLLADALGEDAVVPKGSTGTVVAVWGRGLAFEVEFTEPLETLATIEPDLLRLVRRAGS